MDKTPVSIHKRDSENDDSCQISTEEFSENVDVVWDWNSPQAKQRPKNKKKRLLLHSPKIPIKRHPSSHSIQDFQKLRAELQSLRDEIAIPENEESLLLSPLEEAEYKYMDENEAAFNCYMQERIAEPVETSDLFDDSFDEQLVQFSQQIESELASKILKKPLHHLDNTHKNNSSDSIHVLDYNKVSCNKNKFIFTKVNDDATKSVNDSFDELLGTIEVDNMIECNDNNLNDKNNILTGKVEFHRTKSFELSNLEHSKGIQANKLQEIERKRIDALEKLQIKKKLKIPTHCSTQCSLEEIEQKRRQALAKREAKRQQEIIEQKRQEALRRLEISRKKNATIVRSSLTNRLNC